MDKEREGNRVRVRKPEPDEGEEAGVERGTGSNARVRVDEVVIDSETMMMRGLDGLSYRSWLLELEVVLGKEREA